MNHYVALFTGAWIEIGIIDLFDSLVLVALFTGAWIEIRLLYDNYQYIAGRALYGRVD